MAGASASIYELDNMDWVQHVYKGALTPLTGKTCKYILWKDKHDKYSVNDRL